MKLSALPEKRGNNVIYGRREETNLGHCLRLSGIILLFKGTTRANERVVGERDVSLCMAAK
ncbi:hypothetical protein SDJN02_23029, partial [Cucurbita argyrosperma subsp. argyrosperma]